MTSNLVPGGVNAGKRPISSGPGNERMPRSTPGSGRTVRSVPASPSMDQLHPVGPPGPINGINPPDKMPIPTKGMDQLHPRGPSGPPNSINPPGKMPIPTKGSFLPTMGNSIMQRFFGPDPLDPQTLMKEALLRRLQSEQGY